MPSPARGETLDHLRRSFAKRDANAFPDARAPLPLGLPALDAALQGGLAYGALHELAPAAPGQLGATLGFALTLAALTATDGRVALLIQTDFAAQEGGVPYGPGLEGLGLPMHRLILLRVPRLLDLLGAFEEALKSTAVAVTLAELPEAGADLTATRRLALAARAGGGLGLLLRYRPSPLPSAAMTRWEIAAALSTPDRLGGLVGGLGRTAFALSLIKNRRGPCGRFIACWDHHERIFTSPLSLAVAAQVCDGSVDARALARVG